MQHGKTLPRTPPRTLARGCMHDTQAHALGVVGSTHLGEAEDVVHKQEHILALHVAEVLSHGQACVV